VRREISLLSELQGIDRSEFEPVNVPLMIHTRRFNIQLALFSSAV
jgi:hypothetical protein